MKEGGGEAVHNRIIQFPLVFSGTRLKQRGGNDCSEPASSRRASWQFTVSVWENTEAISHKLFRNQSHWRSGRRIPSSPVQVA